RALVGEHSSLLAVLFPPLRRARHRAGGAIAMDATQSVAPGALRDLRPGDPGDLRLHAAPAAHPGRGVRGQEDCRDPRPEPAAAGGHPVRRRPMSSVPEATIRSPAPPATL